MPVTFKHLANNLTSRITVPIVLIWLLLSAILFFSVDRIVTDFLELNIRENISWLSRSVMDICNRRMDAIIQSGRSNETTYVRINKEQTILEIEDFLRKTKVIGAVRNQSGELLLSIGPPETLRELLAKEISEQQLTAVTLEDQTYSVYRIHFEPWSWELTLIRPPGTYQIFQNRIIHVYLIVGGALSISLFLTVLLVYTSTYRPIKRIIGQLRRDEKPDYRGVYELEFLSTVITANITALNQQIADRVAAEKNLEELEKLLRDIIDSMPSALIGIDDECQVILWNRQAEEIAEVDIYQAEEKELDKLFPLLADQSMHITQAVKEGCLFQQQRLDRLVDGQSRSFELTLYPLVITGLHGAVLRIDDVTKRIQMEEAVVQSEKMMSVGGLAAGMAHEIKNPLGGILQSAQVLQNRLFGNLSANQIVAEEHQLSLDALTAYLKERKIDLMIEAIRDSGKRATQIIDNMLSFGHKSESTYGKHDLRLLLDKTIEITQNDYNLQTDMDFRKIRIIRDYAVDLPLVECEGSAIQQVFLNILKNGAEAMAEVKTEKPRFILRVFQAEQMVQVEIEDNGPGMREDISRRIFEPFFTTKNVGMGTGLGLSVSYFIITENHQGEMRVNSAPDTGTCFVLRLPTFQRNS